MGPGPSLLAPWRVLRVREDAEGPEVVLEDERGERYRLRFDHPESPRLATTAELVATLLLHALGYHVPERHLVVFSPDQLHFPDGVRRSPKLRRDALLGRVGRLPDGSLRALATRLAGDRALGPFRFAGRRVDDANDRLPHERRRELRGLLPVAAFLGLTGISDEVPEDLWLPAERRVGHTLQHLRGALGSTAAGRPKPLWEGNERRLDLGVLGRSLLSLGLWRRTAPELQTRRDECLRRWPGLGWIDGGAIRFQPRRWNEAFAAADDQDLQWGARLVASLDEAQLRVVIAEAWLPTIEARRLLSVLLERRAWVLRTWLRRRAPLDGFTVAGGTALCFTDRWRASGLDPEHTSIYTLRLRTRSGLVAGSQRQVVTRAARICVPYPADALPADDYLVMELRRPRVSQAWIRVHLGQRAGRLVLRGVEP
jgi:hypothetical protein